MHPAIDVFRFAACFLLAGPLAAHTEMGDVVAIARAFPDGGGYEWKGTGVPEDIRFNGKVILAKGKATYCSGFTFAVAMKTAAERGLLRGKTTEQVQAFQKDWYGATKESGEAQ